METTDVDRDLTRQFNLALTALQESLTQIAAAEAADRDGALEVDRPLRMILRAAGYQPDVISMLASLAQSFKPGEDADRDAVRDVDTALRMILRAAGYPPDVVTMLASLAEGFRSADGPSNGLRVADVNRLLEHADEDLLHIVRLWSRPNDDPHIFQAMLVTLLVRRGVPLETSQFLAATINREQGDGGHLQEIARIARFANLAEDSCISVAEPAWLEEPGYARAYAEAKGVSAWGRDIRWRVQTLVKAAAGARHLEGDFVECGVDTGGTARAVMSYLGDETFAERTFYLFDTFQGIVVEQLNANEPAPIEGRFPDVYDVACANFADKPYVRIVRGAVPETLSAYTGSRVAYLHIDMNAAYPEVEALKFFWDLLAPGAMVVFDDYGFPRHREQRIALDEVATSLGVEIMMLPTCQGILVKPASGA